MAVIAQLNSDLLASVLALGTQSTAGEFASIAVAFARENFFYIFLS